MKKRGKQQKKRTYLTFFLQTLELMLIVALAVGVVACWGIEQYDTDDIHREGAERLADMEKWLNDEENADATEAEIRSQLSVRFAVSENGIDRGAVLYDKKNNKVYDSSEILWGLVRVNADEEQRMNAFKEAVKDQSETFPERFFNEKGNFVGLYFNDNPEMLKPFRELQKPFRYLSFERFYNFYVKGDRLYPDKIDVYVSHDNPRESDLKSKVTIDLSQYIPQDSVCLAPKDSDNAPDDAVEISSRLFILCGSKPDSHALNAAHRLQQNGSQDQNIYVSDDLPFGWSVIARNQMKLPYTAENNRWELYTVTLFNFPMYHFFHFLVFGGSLLIFLVMIALFTAKIRYQKYSQEYEMNEYRRNLTGVLAHDLKSPLAVISGYAENLRENVHTEKREAYADSILENTKYMNRIIEDALGLAKLEQTADLRRETVDLVQLATDAVSHYAEQTAAQDITVQCSGECKVSGNPQMMQQAVGNLIANAVKYTPVGGSIDISGTGKALRICNDSNISSADTEKLSEPFVKGDAARSGRSGSGMGLAIVRQIAALHKMQLSISTKDGKFIAELRPSSKKQPKQHS